MSSDDKKVTIPTLISTAVAVGIENNYDDDGTDTNATGNSWQ